jgi:hypothetical protein
MLQWEIKDYDDDDMHTICPGRITNFAAMCMGSSSDKLISPLHLLSEKHWDHDNNGPHPFLPNGN